MISDQEAMGLACESLAGDDFYQPAHRELFKTISEMYLKNIPVDAVTLTDKLKEKGIFEDRKSVV
jgi:replicative DNA helicase